MQPKQRFPILLGLAMLGLTLLVGVVAVTAVHASTPNPSFVDDFDVFDPGRWHKADWGNPNPPFWNYWRPDHIGFADSAMRVRLDDMPCPGGCDGRPYASGEYRTNDLLGHGRFEARFRASNIPGTVTAFFLYTGPWDNNPHDEIDVEILGRDPTRMQVNYFTHGIGQHETWIDLGFDASQDFHTYAFEWQAGALRWYVDGVLRHTETGARGPLPTTPGHLMLSLWACNQADHWCGRFAYPGSAVTAVFDWVRYQARSYAYLPMALRAYPPACILFEDFNDIHDWYSESGNGAVCGRHQTAGYRGLAMALDCQTHGTDDWWFVAKPVNAD